MGKIKESLEIAKLAKCAYRRIYDQLDDEDKKAIDGAIGAGKGSFIITNALHDGGYNIVHSTVGKHLDGRCRCA